MLFDVTHPRVAGLDVHKDQITACVRVQLPDHKPWAQSREFDSTPPGLIALRDWLLHHQVTHVAMEGTGVYWMAPWDLLEAARLDLTLCNAHHVKQVPGRKTDQSDAAWLAQLLAAGLLKKSFVPDAQTREFRELARARTHRIEERTRHLNTIHRLLDRVGNKLGSVLSDLQGKSGLAILTALARGERDANVLAALACGHAKKKRDQLRAVLAAPLTPTARLLLKQELASWAQIDKQIEQIERELRRRSKAYAARIEALHSIGAIDESASWTIVAELGPDPSVFADAHHAAAWAGLAPGQRESAGKSRRTGSREGNAYLKAMLVQIAMVLHRMKAHDLGAWFRKKQVGLGFKKAAVATAHKLLVRIWTLWSTGQTYQPPAPRPLTDRQRTQRLQRSIKTLEDLGFAVDLQPKLAA